MIGCNKLKEVFIMKTKDLPNVASALIEKMKSDGYSSSRIEDTTWILEHFFNYCVKHDIVQVTVPIAVEFVKESFGFDFYNTTSRSRPSCGGRFLSFLNSKSLAITRRPISVVLPLKSLWFMRPSIVNSWIMSTLCRSV